MVEFVAVMIALFLIAGLGRGYVTQLTEVIKQKYRSYCFGVAISDPPDGSFEMINVSDDAGHTMLLSEQIARMSLAVNRENTSIVPVEQDVTRDSVLDFVEQAEDL